MLGWGFSSGRARKVSVPGGRVLPMETTGEPTPAGRRAHHVHRFTGRLHEVLDGLLPAPVLGLTDHELAEAVAEQVTGLARQQRPCDAASTNFRSDLKPLKRVSFSGRKASSQPAIRRR